MYYFNIFPLTIIAHDIKHHCFASGSVRDIWEENQSIGDTLILIQIIKGHDKFFFNLDNNKSKLGLNMTKIKVWPLVREV